jgi:hypothetical protein
MLFAFSGITSPAEMLGVIVGLVILAAVAFSEARRKAILRSHYRASI